MNQKEKASHKVIILKAVFQEDLTRKTVQKQKTSKRSTRGKCCNNLTSNYLLLQLPAPRGRSVFLKMSDVPMLTLFSVQFFLT